MVLAVVEFEGAGLVRGEGEEVAQAGPEDRGARAPGGGGEGGEGGAGVGGGF